ncbi:FAD binding domain-containing protein [Xylariales sp. PMI_506]|nr:FAD binding domain-containing protein [Xylariales sp. PMI_506]
MDRKENENGVIRRSDRIPDTIPGISRFQQSTLHQGRIERFFLDLLESESPIRVERGVMPFKSELDESLVEDADAYPITLFLRHLTKEEATPKQVATSANGVATQYGLFRSNLAADDVAEVLKVDQLRAKASTEEIIKAKYVLEADGAHSWVRREIGITMHGETTDYIWDIPMRCAIHSAGFGSVMVIAREGKLVRLYIQLTTTAKAGSDASRTDRSKINPDVILQSAQKIMAPYKISYRKLDWWTAYQIGQRIATNFSAMERVFLAGDAVHTHSPKAGQGMNVSMADRWKLASVVRGLSSRSILKSYQRERGRITHDLIEFDHKFSRLFSGRPAKDVMDDEGISLAEFKAAFENGNIFASGTASSIRSQRMSTQPTVNSEPSLATQVKVDTRIPSIKILNNPTPLLPSTGAWRILLFTRDIRLPEPKGKMSTLYESLAKPFSLLQRFTPITSRYDSVFETIPIYAAPRAEVTVFDFPDLVRPFDSVEGYDYNKIFVDDQSYHEVYGHLYDNFGINPGLGCVIVVRPDQYISYIGALKGHQSLDKFFSAFMIPQNEDGDHIIISGTDNKLA